MVSCADNAMICQDFFGEFLRCFIRNHIIKTLHKFIPGYGGPGRNSCPVGTTEDRLHHFIKDLTFYSGGFPTDETPARAKILVRVERLVTGNPGDVKPVGEGVSELKIDYGPGYRVYFKKQGQELIILLAGGDKSTQARDIKSALRLARNL